MKKCNIDNTVPSIRNTKCVSNIMWMKKIIYTEVESGKSLVNENLNLHIKFLWVAWRLILKVMFFQLFLKIYKALKQNYSSWKREKAQFLCFISRKPSKLALNKILNLHFFFFFLETWFLSGKVFGSLEVMANSGRYATAHTYFIQAAASSRWRDILLCFKTPTSWKW